jgi:hypothetical protein
VAINKDISSNFALDVSGITQIRGNLDVAGAFTVNGVPISNGGSLTGNVQVGTNSGFVTIDKPQFYSDPSLTIYYDFDTESYNISPNDAITIINKGNGGSSFTATLQGSTTGMIDTGNFYLGTASLRNDTITSLNQGIKINSAVPIGTNMTFSFWLRKKSTPPGTDSDRIFEFSTNPAVGAVGENNSIALDISSSGIILPVLTGSASNPVTSCFGTLSAPIISYNVCDNAWKHIIWSINGSSSIIYVNGSIAQQDTITGTSPFAISSTRVSATIGHSTVTSLGGRDFSGNIDDFRYYKDKALSYAEIYQLYNNNFYTLDICGGFLANGSSVIYEASGSVATANRGTLTLLHGDASGSSSIMFKSVNDPLDYAYIEYDENVTGSTGVNYGLMTIGIENDAEVNTTQADRISLFASGGTGFVGVNTKTPQYSLDVSGQMRIYEGAGTAASAANGSLTLEHANAGGVSSLVFKGPNNSTNDYAYIEYDDNSTITYIQSLYKWNLSPGSIITYNANTTVDTSIGSNTSVTLVARAASFFSVLAPSPPSTFPSNTYCISFNQTNQTGTPGTGNISYLDSGIISMSLTNITISFWIRPNIDYDTNSSNFYRYNIAHISNTSSTSVVDMYIRGYDKTLFVLINDNGSNYKTSNSAIQNNVWTHVAFTFSANNGYIYINGVKDESTVGSGYTNFASLNAYNKILFGMKFGSSDGSSYRKGFRGYMNYINVLNQTLSDSDITYLYNNPSYGETTEGGLMTIGIENDTEYNDRITLWPKGGTGFVGINTKMPQATLDVNGSLNINGNITNTDLPVIIKGQSGTVLKLQNYNQVSSRGEVSIDFFNTNQMGRIKFLDVASDDSDAFQNRLSFHVGYNVSYTIESMRITSKSTNTTNCCDVKIYGDLVAESLTPVSDYRIKENVVPLDASFTVDGLNPVTYNLKSSGKKDIGFIAHEIQEFYPFLVSGEKDGKETQSLNYNGFIGILTKEIQVLKKKVSEQERKSAEQDQRIQALEKMVFNLINK